MIEEITVTQDLKIQTLHQFESDVQKKITLQNYIIGKLVSKLMLGKFLRIDEIETEKGMRIIAKIKVAK